MWLVHMVMAGVAAVDCHAFCGIPGALSDTQFAVNASQIPTELASDATTALAFDKLQIACRRLDPKAVPLRYLGDAVPSGNGFKLILVPALAADICLPR